jgi:hypothetical protein
MQIRSVAYVSTESRPLRPEELQTIFLESRQRNWEHRITGVLLHCPGSFMQFIEGPPAGVEVVCQRILASRHHRGLIELCDEMSDRRNFPRWAMGSTEAPRPFLLNLSTAVWQRQYDATRDHPTDSAGLKMLRSFWDGATGRRDLNYSLRYT